MTNKYSGLSDVELTKKVAEIIYKNYSDYSVGEETYKKKIGILINGDISFEYDLFYDGANVFELMISNDINLIKHGNIYDAVYKYGEHSKPIRSVNENPCRAIAECFLLMNDKENEDEI